MRSKLTSIGLSAVLILVGGLVLLASPLWAVHQGWPDIVSANIDANTISIILNTTGHE
jgi:L-ascorbate metabolism protein UlaG (beta-lactamase superfamily)